MLPSNDCYGNTANQVNYKGRRVVDSALFKSYLSSKVLSRLSDIETTSNIETDLRALASTGMATQTLNKILSSQEHAREPWEIGEALAECILEDELGILWPWNVERDKRTPKASLPGADLVGIYNKPCGSIFLFGEVKTSHDSNSPPNVLYGRTGMIHQLDKLCSDITIHFCLIKWLYNHCKNTEIWQFYQQCVKSYLESNGKNFALFGFLMRDTEPNDLDIKNRAESFVNKITSPMSLEFQVWYLPTSSNKWWPIALGIAS
jgi:hypothetical protein